MLAYGLTCFAFLFKSLLFYLFIYLFIFSLNSKQIVSLRQINDAFLSLENTANTETCLRGIRKMTANIEFSAKDCYYKHRDNAPRTPISKKKLGRDYILINNKTRQKKKINENQTVENRKKKEMDYKFAYRKRISRACEQNIIPVVRYTERSLPAKSCRSPTQDD